MTKRQRKGSAQTTQDQQQPYDNVLKLLLEQQEAAMLPHFLAEVEFLEVLDLEVLRSPLRVDRVYKVQFEEEPHIMLLEVETGSNRKMDKRLLVYTAYLFEKYELPVIAIIIYPFKTTMAISPLVMKSGRQEKLTFHFESIALWKWEAQRFLDRHAVSMYGLLPTMQGADLQRLTQAVKEMEAYYQGDDIRLRREFLCFRVLLERAEVVPMEDKQILKERLKMYNNLLDEDPYIQQKKAEGLAEGEAKGKAEGKAEGLAEGEAKGKAEGEAKGKAEGLAKGLQEAVVTVVRVRFPPLTELAQQKVTHITKPDKLDLLLEQVATVPDEATAHWLFSSLAA